MGESKERQTYFRNGVAVLEPKQALYTTDGKDSVAIVTSPFFEDLAGVKEGDCFQVEFKADLAEKPTNKVFDAEIFRLDTVFTWGIDPIVRDTTDSIIGEQLITPAFSRSQFLKGRLFIQTDHNALRKQEDLFDLSFDGEKPVVDTIDVNRIYEICLRSIRKGQEVDTVPTRWKKTNAFVLDDFMKKAKVWEEEKGKDSLFLRFKYLQRIEVYNILEGNVPRDSVALKWNRSDPFGFALSEIEE